MIVLLSMCFHQRFYADISKEGTDREAWGLEVALRGIRMTPVDLSFPKDHLGLEAGTLPLLSGLLRSPLSYRECVDDFMALPVHPCGPTGLLEKMIKTGMGLAYPEPGEREASHSPRVDLLGYLPELEGALSAACDVCSESGGGKDAWFVQRACAEILTGTEGVRSRLLENSAAVLERISTQPILLAGCRLYATVDRIVPSLQSITAFPPAICSEATGEGWSASGNISYYRDTDLGPVVIGGPGENRYEGRFYLLVDPGGNDRYLFQGVAPGTVSVIIDLEGIDTYEGEDFSLATGFFGIGLLIDCSGDDTYRAGDFTCGCGIAGLGILDDRSGKDVFEGGCTSQGAGVFRGAGMLCDREGDDMYRVDLYGQGFGAAAGAGLLLDERGRDDYFAGGKYRDYREGRKYYRSLSQGCGMGFRPTVPGGIGILCDREGDDRYEGDYFVQGTGSWYGLGMLLDHAGNDVYQARRYSQGAGVHAAVGILADDTGDDRFQSWGVSQGTGHDLAIGILLEGGGHDRYLASWLCRGAGASNGIGLFLEMAGDDTYGGGERECEGSGRRNRSFGSVGLFIDYEGNDTYDRTGHNRGSWLQSEYGIGIDVEKTEDFH